MERRKTGRRNGRQKERKEFDIACIFDIETYCSVTDLLFFYLSNFVNVNTNLPNYFKGREDCRFNIYQMLHDILGTLHDYPF